MGNNTGITLFDAADNRDAVYRDIQQHLSAARAKVLIALWELGSGTDNDIAEKLSWSINRVTGRRHELCKMALVIKAGEQRGPYNERRTVWKVNEIQINYFLTQQQE